MDITRAAAASGTTWLALVCCALLACVNRVYSQPLAIHTLAGRDIPGSANGFGSNARFNHPHGVVTDGIGNVFVADTKNGTIRKIAPDGLVSTLAGLTGNFGRGDGTGTNAQFYGHRGIAVDGTGSLYVADSGNGTIRNISPEGAVNTFAGAAAEFNSFDGPGANARFYHPEAIAVGPGGNIYVADAWNHTIRKITPEGTVTTLAGLAGHFGSADGTNSKARFHRPSGIAVDGATNLFVVDSLNHTIRKITPGGTVSTIAGLPGVWGSADGTNSDARFFQPQGIVVGAGGQLIVADTGNQTLREISPSGTNWIVTTMAGSLGNAGSADGDAGAARFNFPTALARDGDGYLYIADSGNHTIRTTRVVPPTLQFNKLSDRLILTWPTSSEGFLLETTPLLGPGETWSTLTHGIDDLGDNFAQTNAVISDAAFFRLNKP